MQGLNRLKQFFYIGMFEVKKRKPKREFISRLYKIIIFVLIIGLLSGSAGCSLPQLSGSEEQGGAQPGQTDTKVTKKERKDPGTVQVAQPVAGQKENPVLSPDEQGRIAAGIQETLTTLIEAMRIKDLSKAETFFYGLDEAGSVITMEELQLEVETLHPVEWRVESSRPAEKDSRLVEVSFTMPNGSLYKGKPFNMVNIGEAWVIHYNSFAASFHAMAEHMLGRGSEVNGDALVEKIF